MESDTEKLIRLLIVDEGMHKAEQIISALRAAGVQVRAEFAEDAGEANARRFLQIAFQSRQPRNAKRQTCQGCR